MANTKELLMRELSEDKETQPKICSFSNRIFRKEGYVKALENLMKLSKEKHNHKIVMSLKEPSYGFVFLK